MKNYFNSKINNFQICIKIHLMLDICVILFNKWYFHSFAI